MFYLNIGIQNRNLKNVVFFSGNKCFSASSSKMPNVNNTAFEFCASVGKKNVSPKTLEEFHEMRLQRAPQRKYDILKYLSHLCMAKMN